MNISGDHMQSKACGTVKVLFIIFSIIALQVSIGTGQVWNLYNDYVSGTNPNGAWKYTSLEPGNPGWEGPLSDKGGGWWMHTGYTSIMMYVGQYDGAWGLKSAADEIALNSNAVWHAVMQWTAPQAGTYQIDATFRGAADPAVVSQTPTPVYIQKNLVGANTGNPGAALYYSSVTDTTTLLTPSITVTLAAGDTISFACSGLNHDGYSLRPDWVALKVNIEQISEPATIIFQEPLENAIPVNVGQITRGNNFEILLPGLPETSGKAIVLRFRGYWYYSAPAGLSQAMKVSVNDTFLTRTTGTGGERLIGRSPTFTLAGESDYYPVFNGDEINALYAPSANVADSMITGGFGSWFMLDISDMTRGVDGNIIRFYNIHSLDYVLHIEQCEIGWIDKSLIVSEVNRAPVRNGDIAGSLVVNGVTLSQSTKGGFSLKDADGDELLIETAINMGENANSELIADDTLSTPVTVSFSQSGSNKFIMNANWPKFTLSRELTLSSDGLVWQDTWTNISSSLSGLPFRHKFFIKNEQADFLIGGNPDIDATTSCAFNPTVFVSSPGHPGNGMGITAESDKLRLLMRVTGFGGLSEIYAQDIALSPGASLTTETRISVVSDGGGYWSFINDVRDRWGANGVCIDRPMFIDFTEVSGATYAQRVAGALNQLGPVYVAHAPWIRLHQDAEVVRTGTYPKLPGGAATTPGLCPTLDVDAYLTFAHRFASWYRYGWEVGQIHAACPNVKVIQMMHPSMEVAYKPAHNQWPWFNDAILRSDGTVFESRNYTVSWLWNYADLDWEVYYYLPRQGSAYYNDLISSIQKSMDEYDSDGIYCDEFSWVSLTRQYSRYDYSRWDGFSVDLDSSGNVVRQKTDCAYATETAQAGIFAEVSSRNGFLLANTPAALRSINNLPILRFVEGGNGIGAFGYAHLSHVPLVLGNYGDYVTKQGVFEAVKAAVERGCVYSPMYTVNILFDRPENFVCKLYPITIKSIGQGVINGEERIITTKSGEYFWGEKGLLLKNYVFDSLGNLVNTITYFDLDGRIDITVPVNGLVIAEKIKAGCDVYDFDSNNEVNLKDLKVMADCWLNGIDCIWSGASSSVSKPTNVGFEIFSDFAGCW
ncbi:MAG: hypothetical protein A2Y13_05420 [Planctomycetes bacterium GWC2_45_44]|nr:MAG: hypothetical protein A2Y13_05420 [Planctomycetes bacterium GWC2_45_44]